jgi:adenosylhomocysteine nucleosidase
MVIRSTSEFNPIGKNYTCGTGDSFVENIERGDSNIDVFDMEAYALAKVCYHYDMPFISFKYVTDNVNEHSPKNWKENCSDGVSEFKEKILVKC